MKELLGRLIKMKKIKNKEDIDCPYPVDDEWQDLNDEQKKDCLKKNKTTYTNRFLFFTTMSWIAYIGIWVFLWAVIDMLFYYLSITLPELIFYIILPLIGVGFVILLVFIDRRKHKYESVLED